MVSTGLFRPAEHFYPANFHLQNLILLVLLEAIESTKCIDYYFAKLCVLMDRRFSTLIVCWLVIKRYTKILYTFPAVCHIRPFFVRKSYGL